MLTNYIGTYTINVAKGLTETYMRNKLIVDMQLNFNWTVFIIVLLWVILVFQGFYRGFEKRQRRI